MHANKEESTNKFGESVAKDLLGGSHTLGAKGGIRLDIKLNLKIFEETLYSHLGLTRAWLHLVRGYQGYENPRVC